MKMDKFEFVVYETDKGEECVIVKQNGELRILNYPIYVVSSEPSPQFSYIVYSSQYERHRYDLYGVEIKNTTSVFTISLKEALECGMQIVAPNTAKDRVKKKFPICFKWKDGNNFTKWISLHEHVIVRNGVEDKNTRTSGSFRIDEDYFKTSYTEEEMWDYYYGQQKPTLEDMTKRRWAIWYRFSNSSSSAWAISCNKSSDIISYHASYEEAFEACVKSFKQEYKWDGNDWVKIPNLVD